MKNVLLRESLRIAKDKLPRHPQFHCYPHMSFIVQNNKIIEWATNTCNEPPAHLGYRQRVSWGVAKSHSEYNAWIAARGLLIPNERFDVINIRLNRNGEMKLSAPCSCCHNFLCAMGCTSAHFTTDVGWASMKLTA